MNEEQFNSAMLDMERQLAISSIDYFRKRVLKYNDFKPFHKKLDRVWDTPKRFALIMIPRNHLKSSWCMSMILHELLRNPNMSVLYETAIYKQAVKYVGEMKDHIQSPEWKELFGDWQGATWGRPEFTVHQRHVNQVAPTASASGLDKTQTGQHYDLIVLDDLVDEHNHRTPDGRQKPKDRFKQAMSLLRPGGRLVVIGTPWDRDDLYAHIQKTPTTFELFDFVKMSCFNDPDDELGTSGLIFPEKFVLTNAEALVQPGTTSIQALRGEDEFHFYCQYLVNPKEELFSEFKLSWLRWMPTDAMQQAMRENRGTVRIFCDPALGKENSKKACDTGIIVTHSTSEYEPKLHVLLAEGTLLAPFATVERLDDLAVIFDADEICVETIAFQEVVAQMLEEVIKQKKRKYRVRRMMPMADKERRIRSLFGYYQAGLIIHDEKLKNEKLEDQLFRFPKGELRDVVDALSQFCYIGQWAVRKPKNPGMPEHLNMPYSKRAPRYDIPKPESMSGSYMSKGDSAGGGIFDVGQSIADPKRQRGRVDDFE